MMAAHNEYNAILILLLVTKELINNKLKYKAYNDNKLCNYYYKKKGH
mgnify:CR=1 FL=1